MNRKLVLIAVALLGILGVKTSEAYVCRLGDAGCSGFEFYGTGAGVCGSDYIPCDNPRVGAVFCKEKVGENFVVKYKKEDCCSSDYYAGYSQCNSNWEKGYGNSCKGSVSGVTIWEQCGCQYGFSEVDGSGTFYEAGKQLIDKCGGFSYLFGSRCMGVDVGSENCKFVNCNTDRHFVPDYEARTKVYCKVRLDTNCGAMGCQQVYDCDNEKEYYRNDSVNLADGIVNFIANDANDPLSNESLSDENSVYDILNGCGEIKFNYNLVNRYVCNYKQGNNEQTQNEAYGLEDVGDGFDCGEGVPNYCYLWQGCNNTRKWFNTNGNMGVLYGENNYPEWVNQVEEKYDGKSDAPDAQVVYFGDELRNELHENFLSVVNPNYNKYEALTPGYDDDGNPILSYDGKSLSLCKNITVSDDREFKGENVEGTSPCYIVNKNNGCAYIVQDCHQNDAGHRCWKKIGCANENRFYSSFINAAVLGYDNDATALTPNSWYETSINTSFYNIFYNGLDEDEIYPGCVYRINNCNDASGCYRKEGCAEGFEDIRDHTEIETDWEPWFEDVRPICNDNTRCYKATSCSLDTGAYSATPNTSFFITINSTATGLTCYKGIECRYDSGSYTSTPNTSFFNVIDSLATGSVCYRGQNCHIEAGAYTSKPNEFFFHLRESISSGSTCYRGVLCIGLDEGAYTSEPNTSFFETISSFASGSSCYRGQNCHIEAGSYTSTPNTSFFTTVSSLASGSACYRGQNCHIEAGAYTSTPNTLFFDVIDSLSSGSTCYRGVLCKFSLGTYSSHPNTSFFLIVMSHASGSECYRNQGCHIEAGSYEANPNTSFFVTIQSLASGSTCYRGQECYIEAGSYTSTPNTSFFITIDSLSSGSTCYRGQECNIAVGAYTSTPNLYFFNVQESLSSGSTCYRGVFCLGLDGGAYTSEPNTSFFEIISSFASGSSCYRGQNCYIDAGSYTSTPNTSFFNVVNSLSSGSICYRGQECYIEAGSYTSTPNTSFFITIDSLSSGSTCYRGQECNIAVGAYTSTPNTAFFDVIDSLSSGSTCYRGPNCAPTANDFENTSFFNMVYSISSGSTCYRSTGCHIEAGSYTSAPNTSFFMLDINNNAEQDSTCYRIGGCNWDAGAYSSTPNTSFFITIHSLASGSTSYRAEEAHLGAGSYTSTPNTSFFITISSHASGSIAYRAEDAHIATGSYTSTPNTSFFITISSLASGSTAYRGESAHIIVGAYSSTPNTSFFSVVSSHASGSIAYRAEDTHIKAGGYTSTPNTSFFITISSHASGSTAYRGESAHIKVGAYSSTPNTSFFNVVSSHASGSIAYRAEDTHIKAGGYTSTPNTSFFITISSHASGSTTYRGESAHLSAGSYSSTPNEVFFNTISSHASGSTAYRAESVCIDCGSYTSTPNTSFFITVSSHASGSISYRAQEQHISAGAYENAPNTSFFITIHSEASGVIAFRAESVNTKAGAYKDTPNTAFFNTSDSHGSGSRCYRGTSCAITAVVSENKNTSFFVYNYSQASGSTCYRSSACNEEVGSYSTSPNTSFFRTLHSTNAEQDSTCYRTSGCHIEAGAYETTPNTSFFITVHSESSGSIAYRAERAHIEAGAYSSTPNTSFFITVKSLASGSTSYRAIGGTIPTYSSSPNTSFFITISSHASGIERYRGESAHLKAGAYAISPNTLFFITISSHASGSISYRAESVNIDVGGYTSTPNTSFFYVGKSVASGSMGYRAQRHHYEVGAYAISPNTMFFNTISSHASGSEVYRAESVNLGAGAYSSIPNTSFFIVDYSLGSGSISYRGNGAHLGAGAYASSPNTSFFHIVTSSASGTTVYRADSICHDCGDVYTEPPSEWFFAVISSHASGSIAYRAEIANEDIGAYSSTPNTSFFIVITSTSSGSTSYRAIDSHLKAGAYRDAPNTIFFNTIYSLASGSTAYRAESVCIGCGSYTSTPNTSFFIVDYSLGSGSTSYRGNGAHLKAGAYAGSPNTMFFNTISSHASGTEVYRAKDVNIIVGAYSSTPNTSFFIVDYSLGSGLTSYRGNGAHLRAGAYAISPNTMFFNTISSHASGTEVYRAESAKLGVGSYTSSPNTSFFVVESSHASGSASYRGGAAHIRAGAYTSTPNTSFFITISSVASGSTSYRGERAHIEAGAYSSTPNIAFFITVKSLASGSTSYRAIGGTPPTYSSAPNTSFFITIRSHASGIERYRGESAHLMAGAYATSPNEVFFNIIKSLASGSTSYRAESVNIEAGSYTSTPNEVFFNTIKSLASGSTSYRAKRVNTDDGSYPSSPNTAFFETIHSHASGIISFRASSINYREGAYDSSPNTSFFDVDYSLGTGLKSWRGDRIHIKAGAYEFSPNTSFFITTTSYASGKQAYRAEKVNEEAGATTTIPNETFFDHVSSHASGSICYRAIGCSDVAYSSKPSTSFFNVEEYTVSHSTCYRGTSCNIKAGAYSITPNTAFFNYDEQTQNTTCYRGTECSAVAFSYTPNTSFFVVVKSLSSGSECFRGDICAPSRGSYASIPNVLFFHTISSTANTTCYRADRCNTGAQDFGIETYDVNSSLFIETSLTASGSTCYRADSCNKGNFAYTEAEKSNYVLYYSADASKHSGITCYKGSACKEATGYKDPTIVNTSYFANISSVQYDFGKFCARGAECNIPGGAYSSHPNTQYFITSSQKSGEDEGLECYRADRCNIEGGAYTSKPNILYFKTTKAHASGIECYRANGCITSKPNTSYFLTINSLASGTECFRANACNMEAGAYSSYPNTQFFIVWFEKHSNITCYRSTAGCNIGKGAYTSSPNETFFKVITSLASGSTCYRGVSCNADKYASTSIPNTYYFATVYSKATGTTCYRATGCATGAVDINVTGGFLGNEQIFSTTHSYANGNSIYCGRLGCNSGFYTVTSQFIDTNNNSKFVVNTSSSSTSWGAARTTCYGATGCNEADGYFETDITGNIYLDSSYFAPANTTTFSFKGYDEVNTTVFTVKCKKARGCADGTFTTEADINTEYFIVDSKSYRANSYTQTCYRATGCQNAYGYSLSEDKINTSYFTYNTSSASGITCYVGKDCATSVGAYVYDTTDATTLPNTSFFRITIKSTLDESKNTLRCYRATSCNENNHAYTSKPNTSFFTIEVSTLSGSTCYRAIGCNSLRFPGTGPEFNSSAFNEISRDTYGNRTCVKYECNEDGGYFDTNNVPPYFASANTSKYGLRCYYATGCNRGLYYENDSTYGTVLGSYTISEIGDYITNLSAFAFVDTSYFDTTCRYSIGCKDGFENLPGSNYQNYHNKYGGYSIDYQYHCYQSTGCKAGQNGIYAYESQPNALYFAINSQTLKSGVGTDRTCYAVTDCASGTTTTQPNSLYFEFGGESKYGYNGTYYSCYKSTACADGAYEYSSRPSTNYFTTSAMYDSSYGKSCYRATACNTANYYNTSRPNELYFHVDQKSASGINCYKATACHGYTVSDAEVNTCFFTYIERSAPGKYCYQPTGCATDEKGIYDARYGMPASDTSAFSTTRQLEQGDYPCALASCNTDGGYINTSDYSSNSAYYNEWFDFRKQSGETRLWYAEFNTRNPSNNFSCYKINGCNTTSNLIVTISDFSNYNTSGYTTSGYNVTSKTESNVTCYKSTSCSGNYHKVSHTTSRPSTNYFDSGLIRYDITNRPHWKEQFFCAYATGCASGASSSYPNTLYFNTPTSETKTKSDGSSFTCYKSTGCKYNTSTATPKNCTLAGVSGKYCCIKDDGVSLTSCIDTTNNYLTWNGTTCRIPECNYISETYGNYSSSCNNTSYFKQNFEIELSNGSTLTGPLVQTYALTGPSGQTYGSLKCLTQSPVNALQNCVTNDKNNKNNGMYKYYTFDSGATCGNTTAYKVNGCDNSQLSYNVNYVSKINNVELKDSNGSSITGTDASVSNYEDVFTLITPDKAYYNGSTLSDTNCATCVVACACNTANGWTSTKPTSGSYYVAKNKVNMAYKSLYNAPTATSMTTNVLTSGTQTLISQGSQAYGISTMSTASTTYDVTTTGSEPLTCYKQNNNYYACTYTISRIASSTHDEFALTGIDCVNPKDATDTVHINSSTTLSISTVLNKAKQLPTFKTSLKHNFVTYDTPAYWSSSKTAFVGDSLRGKEISMSQTGALGLYKAYKSFKAKLEFNSILTEVSGAGFVLTPEDSSYTKSLDKYLERDMEEGAYSTKTDTSNISDFIVFNSSKTVGYIATNKLYTSSSNYYIQGQEDNEDYEYNGSYPAVNIEIEEIKSLIYENKEFSLADFVLQNTSSVLNDRTINPNTKNPHFKLFAIYEIDDYGRIINSSDSHNSEMYERPAFFDPISVYQPNGKNFGLKRIKAFLEYDSGPCTYIMDAQKLQCGYAEFMGYSTYWGTDFHNRCPMDRFSHLYTPTTEKASVSHERIIPYYCPSGTYALNSYCQCNNASTSSSYLPDGGYVGKYAETLLYNSSYFHFVSGANESRGYAGSSEYDKSYTAYKKVPLLYVNGGVTTFGLTDDMYNGLHTNCQTGETYFDENNYMNGNALLIDATCPRWNCCTDFKCNEKINALLEGQNTQTNIPIDSKYEPLRGIATAYSDNRTLQASAPNGITCTVHRCNAGEVHDYVVGGLPNSSHFDYTSRVYGYTNTSGTFVPYDVDESTDTGETHCITITGCKNGYTLYNKRPETSCTVDETTGIVNCPSFEGYYYGLNVNNAYFCLKSKAHYCDYYFGFNQASDGGLYDELEVTKIACDDGNTYTGSAIASFISDATKLPKFDVGATLAYNRFSSRAQMDNQSTMVPDEYKGKIFTWKSTAENGLFTIFDTLRGTVNMTTTLVNTSSFIDGHKGTVLKKESFDSYEYNPNTTISYNLGSKASINTCSFATTLYGATWDGTNGTITDNSTSNAGEFLTKSLYSSNNRFTTLYDEPAIDIYIRPVNTATYYVEKNGIKYYTNTTKSIEVNTSYFLKDRLFDGPSDFYHARLYLNYNISSGNITSTSNGYDTVTAKLDLAVINGDYTQGWGWWLPAYVHLLGAVKDADGNMCTLKYSNYNNTNLINLSKCGSSGYAMVYYNSTGVCSFDGGSGLNCCNQSKTFSCPESIQTPIVIHRSLGGGGGVTIFNHSPSSYQIELYKCNKLTSLNGDCNKSSVNFTEAEFFSADGNNVKGLSTGADILDIPYILRNGKYIYVNGSFTPSNYEFDNSSLPSVPSPM